MHRITKIKIFILFSCTQHLKHSHYSNPALRELTVSETVNVNVDPVIKALHQMQTCCLEASSEVAGKGRLKNKWHDVHSASLS